MIAGAAGTRKIIKAAAARILKAAAAGTTKRELIKAAASGTRVREMTAGSAGNKNEATAAGTKGGSTKTCQQEHIESSSSRDHKKQEKEN